MTPQFKRILDLVRRTGDRLVITDPDGENAYVLMDIASYEDLVMDDGGDWGEDLVDDWLGPETDVEEELFTPEETQNRPEPTEPILEAVESIVNETLDDLPEELRAAVERDLATIESWQKEKKEEISKDEPKNDLENPDEERFYLEPID